ncbi:MAG: hypothetical protein FWC91_14395, partial [Defluviitaleaceae bacterium]|nr:hypothetical protein [Defluviitaleaceae bacterium]
PSGRVAIPAIKGGGAAALRALGRALTSVTPVALPVSNLQTPNAPSRQTTTAPTVPPPSPRPTPPPPRFGPSEPLPIPQPAPTPTPLPREFADIINNNPRGEEYRFFAAEVCEKNDTVVPHPDNPLPLTLSQAAHHANQLLPHERPPDRPAQGVMAFTQDDARELLEVLGGIDRWDTRRESETGYFPHGHPIGKDWIHVWYPR